MPVYVVTAVNRGLGLEYVRQLSQDSNNTIIGTYRASDVDLTDVKKIASAKTHLLVCDIGEEKSVQAFAPELTKALQGAKIDYLINNAGVNASSDQTSLSLTADALYENIRINAVGPALVTQYIFKQGLFADNVRIVNITSGLGSMVVSLSITPRKCAPYSMSKAALNSLTVQQSGELREKLSDAVVVCVDPGWVLTRMGGEGAQIDANTAIGGILKAVHGLKSEDNGKFYTYTGETVPW